MEKPNVQSEIKETLNRVINSRIVELEKANKTIREIYGDDYAKDFITSYELMGYLQTAEKNKARISELIELRRSIYSIFDLYD